MAGRPALIGSSLACVMLAGSYPAAIWSLHLLSSSVASLDLILPSLGVVPALLFSLVSQCSGSRLTGGIPGSRRLFPFHLELPVDVHTPSSLFKSSSKVSLILPYAFFLALSRQLMAGRLMCKTCQSSKLTTIDYFFAQVINLACFVDHMDCPLKLFSARAV